MQELRLQLNLYAPLMHEQSMRSARYIWMNCHWENKLVVLAIKVVEMIAPDVLDVPSVYITMAVRCFLDEHHRRQVVQIPVRWNLDQTCVSPHIKGFHPRLGILRIVNLGPRCSHGQVVGLTVVMAHATVVLNSIVQKKLGTLAAGFPPVTASEKQNFDSRQGLCAKSLYLPRCDTTPGRFAGKFGELAVRLI